MNITVLYFFIYRPIFSNFGISKNDFIITKGYDFKYKSKEKSLLSIKNHFYNKRNIIGQTYEIYTMMFSIYHINNA